MNPPHEKSLPRSTPTHTCVHTRRWYLRDRSFDVEEAEEKLTKMLIWRRDFQWVALGSEARGLARGLAFLAGWRGEVHRNLATPQGGHALDQPYGCIAVCYSAAIATRITQLLSLPSLHSRLSPRVSCCTSGKCEALCLDTDADIVMRQSPSALAPPAPTDPHPAPYPHPTPRPPPHQLHPALQPLVLDHTGRVPLPRQWWPASSHRARRLFMSTQTCTGDQ